MVAHDFSVAKLYLEVVAWRQRGDLPTVADDAFGVCVRVCGWIMVCRCVVLYRWWLVRLWVLDRWEDDVRWWLCTLQMEGEVCGLCVVGTWNELVGGFVLLKGRRNGIW